MDSTLHNYQYSVQVKSRFDLLQSNDFSNQDPDILIQKIRSSKRNNSSKKTAGKNKHSDEKASEKTGFDAVSSKDVIPAVEKQNHKGSAPNSISIRQIKNDEEDVAEDNDSYVREREATKPIGRVAFVQSDVTMSRSTGHAQRDFDRHSGSVMNSVKPKLKKGGHGLGNVGTIEDELDAELINANEFEQDISDERRQKSPITVVDEPSDELKKTITLKEYKEIKKSLKPTVHLSTKSTRQANDGKNVFSNMTPHNKPKNVKQVVGIPDAEMKISEVQKPTFFEFEREKSLRGRNTSDQRFGGSERRHIGLELQPEDFSYSQKEYTRPSQRDRPRNSERGFTRGVNRDFHGGAESSLHIIDKEMKHEQGNISTFNEFNATNIKNSGSRGRGNSLRGRGQVQKGGSFPVPRGRPSNFEEPSTLIIQPPSMDSDLDFPSLV